MSPKPVKVWASRTSTISCSSIPATRKRQTWCGSALEAQHPILPVFPNNPRLPQERALPEEKSFLALSPATVQCSAFYRDRGRHLVRVYESAGCSAKVSLELPFQISEAKEVDFNGNPLQKPVVVTGKTVRLDINPWEIVTLAVS